MADGLEAVSARTFCELGHWPNLENRGRLAALHERCQPSILLCMGLFSRFIVEALQ